MTSSISSVTETSLVSPESPWLGLRSFTEQVSQYFFGRDREIEEVAERIQLRPLTVLFGQSGLGKTSLIQAGVVRRLKAAGYQPVLVRLIHDPDILNVALERQVLLELSANIQLKADRPAAQSSTLWELFHDPQFGYAGSNSEIPVRPILVIDQFEEIFTIGESRRLADANAFLEALACVVENRPPKSVLDRMASDEEFADRLRHSARPCRVVVSMRSDFLHQLERHRQRMPSMMDNRFELRRLTGLQAMQAVYQPALRRTIGSALPPILNEQTAEAIVRLVAGKEADVPLTEIDNVPPLLSLICEQLNVRRLTSEALTIEKSDVTGSAEQVLQNFVLSSFQEFHPGVREFIEDSLISLNGFRQSLNLDSATDELAAKGIANPDLVLRDLVHRRLLTVEDRGGIARIELTHDILAPVIQRLKTVGTPEQALQQAYLIYDSLGDAHNRERLQLVAQRVFRSLATRDSDGEFSLRSLTILEAAAEIGANSVEVIKIVKAFRNGGILIVTSSNETVAQQMQLQLFSNSSSQRNVANGDTDFDVAETDSIQVVHRSLFRQWNLLQAWLADEQAAVSMYLRLEEAVRANVKRLDDVTLDQAIEWRDRFQPNEAWARRWQRSADKTDAGPILSRCEQLIDSSQQLRVEEEDADQTMRAQLLANAEKLALAESEKANAARKLADAERERADVERRKSHAIRKWLLAVVCLAIAAAALAAVALIESSTATQAQRIADDKERQAVANEMLAKDEANRADEMLKRSEHLLYVSNVRAAEQSYQGGHSYSCRSLLNSCRWDFRGFDHAELSERTRTQHSDSVRSVSYSPDGKQFVSGSSDNSIKMWDAAMGSEIRTLKGHADSVNCVIFSPDGKQIVSGSSDNTIKVWDAATGSEVRTLKGLADSVNSVIFSPDGKQIVSGSSDNTIKVWDVATGSEVRTLKGHQNRVRSVSFSPDAKQLVSGSEDNTIKVWDAETWSEVRSLTGHAGSVTSVSFSPDAKQLISGSSDNTIKVWDAETWSEVRTLTEHSESVRSVSFSPDGKRFVSGSEDNTIKVWDTVTWSEVRTLTEHQSAINSVSFSPDGKQLVSGPEDGTIKLWDTETWFEVRTLSESRTLTGHSGPISSVSFSPDGKQFVSGSFDNTIKVWDTATWSEVCTLTEHSESVRSVSFSPDGKHLVSGSNDNTIKVWDAETWSEVRTLTEHSESVRSVSFSPDGKRFVSGSEDNTIKVWDTVTWSEVRTLTGHQSTVNSVSFSPDGKLLVSGAGFALAMGVNDIKVWETATWSQVITLAVSDPVWSVSFSPDGRQLVCGSVNNTFQVWDAATWSKVRRLHMISDLVNSVSFSPDGKLLVTGTTGELFMNSLNNEIKLWDAATWSEVRTITGHSRPINSVSFSPDGKHLVSGLSDNTIKVWDGSRRRAMLPIRLGSDVIHAASISADETLIVSGSQNGLIQVSDGFSGQIMQELPDQNDPTQKGHKDPVQTVAVSPLRKRLGDENDEIAVNSPELIHRMQQIASGSSDRTVRLWDLELLNRRVLKARETILEFDKEQRVQRLDYSEDGRFIAAGGDSGLVKIWNTETHELVDSFDAHERYVKSLQFADHDSKLITSGWVDDRGPTDFKLWQIDDGKRNSTVGATLMNQLPGNWHSGLATHGNFVATGRSDGIVLMRDLKSGTQPLIIKAHPGRKETNASGQEELKDSDIQAITFSPDGKLLATAGIDHTIRLWNPKTGDRLAILDEHTAAVNSLQFYHHSSRGKCDPDELRLVSSGSDGTVRVWLIDEILAHASLSVSVESVPFPQIAKGSQDATVAPNEVIALLNPLVSGATQETTKVPQQQKSGPQSSPHRELAFAIIILAVLSLFLTFFGHRRKRAV